MQQCGLLHVTCSLQVNLPSVFRQGLRVGCSRLFVADSNSFDTQVTAYNFLRVAWFNGLRRCYHWDFVSASNPSPGMVPTAEGLGFSPYACCATLPGVATLAPELTRAALTNACASCLNSEALLCATPKLWRMYASCAKP